MVLFLSNLLLAVGLPSFMTQVWGCSDDMEGAYRQIPVIDDHLRYSVIAIWHPVERGWRFAILYGLAFGLSAAVLHFNRWGGLLTALSRRWLAVPLVAFFDDFKSTDAKFCIHGGARCVRGLFDLVGSRLDPNKRQAPNNYLIFGRRRRLSTS